MSSSIGNDLSQHSSSNIPGNTCSSASTDTDFNLPERFRIPDKYKWDLDTIFPSPEAWSKEFEAVKNLVDEFIANYNSIGKTAADLLNCIKAMQAVEQRLYAYQIYCALNHDLNTEDQSAIIRNDAAGSLAVKFAEACSFFDPQMQAIGYERIQEFYCVEPELKVFDNSFQDLFRQAEFVCPAEIEKVLARVGKAAQGPENNYLTLVDTDLTFAEAVASDSSPRAVNQGSIHELLTSPDRSLRKSAWESYHASFYAFRNVLTGIYANHIEHELAHAKTRGYESTLHQVLHPENISTEIYHNTIKACRDGAKTWQRLFQLKAQLLGYTIKPWDIHAPLTTSGLSIEYDKAVELVLASLQPLGTQYVEIARRGLLEERWVDVYPTKSKRSNAYSHGMYGTKPYILLNYTPNLTEASTITHELGHSMHSYFSWQEQPYCYSVYSVFATEVASTLNQNLFRKYLFDQAAGDKQQILSILDEALYVPHRYLLVMPMLSELEYFAHQKVAEGEGLNADLIEEKVLELFKVYYGESLELDRPELLATFWSTFSHFYLTYYTFQYATGIAAGYQISEKILAGNTQVLDGYLKFLKSGSFHYPLDALQLAGVDLRTTAPFTAAFNTLEQYADMLEGLM